MTSIMAIVSKAVFEKEARGLLVGSIYKTQKYTSKSAVLEPLKSGGDLYLVTVRPGDILWLVGVLTSPTFENDGWVSQQANVVPITDITSAIPSFRFSTGKGVQCESGKLGMSLQTPRQLTSSDISLLGQVPAGLGTSTTTSPHPGSNPSNGTGTDTGTSKGKGKAKVATTPQKIQIKYKGQLLTEVKSDATELYLSNKNIKDIRDIQGFDQLVNLKQLDLSHNQIDTINGLDGLVNLEKLDLSENKITKIEGLDPLVQLHYLRLDKNQISTIEGLGTLTRLEYLLLDNNLIPIPGLITTTVERLGDFKVQTQHFEVQNLVEYCRLKPEERGALKDLNVRVFRRQLLEKVTKNALHIYDPPVEGSTDEEILALEKKYNAGLPKIYKEFLKVAGKRLGNGQLHRALTLEHLDERNAALMDSHLCNLKDFLVFFALDDRYFACFQMPKESIDPEDPMVYFYYQKDKLREYARLIENIDPHHERIYEGLLSNFILNNFYSCIFEHKLFKQYVLPQKQVPFTGDYAQGFLRKGISWPPSAFFDGKAIKPQHYFTGWIAPCYVDLEGDPDFPHVVLRNEGGRKIEDWDEEFILADDEELESWLLKAFATGKMKGIDAVRLTAMESTWGGFYLTGEEYREIAKDKHFKVKACKHCDHFLPVAKKSGDNDDGKPEEDKGAEAEADEGPFDTGNLDYLPKWTPPPKCPFCKNNLDLVDRKATYRDVVYDPAREIQDLQSMDNTIQDSALVIPVTYDGQPYWVMHFGSSLSKLLVLAIKEKQKKNRKQIRGMGPVLVWKSFAGIDAICFPKE